MVYVLFKEEMDYEILEGFGSAAEEVELWVFIEYWASLFFNAEVLDVEKYLLYLGFFSELFWEYPAVDKPHYRGKFWFNFKSNPKS